MNSSVPGLPSTCRFVVRSALAAALIAALMLGSTVTLYLP